MGNQRFWRQMKVVSPKDLNFNITIIGLGGIGSPTTLALAKMGCSKLFGFDPDSIESHNLPSQFYRETDLGKFKALALAEIVKDFTGVEMKAYVEKFEKQTLAPGLVISGVDTMKARQDIWRRVCRKPSTPLYIEARMGAEIARIYSIQTCNPLAIKFYEGMFYSDEQAVNLPCTARAIVYNVFAIASLIASQVKRYSQGEKIHKEIIFDLKNLVLTYC